MVCVFVFFFFFFSSRRRHTRFDCDWSSDVCSSDLEAFCSVYDEDATYASPSGLVRGPAAVLGRYRKRYPDRAAMGTLRLEVLETRAAADPDGDRGAVQGVSILARWRLAYPDKPEASGLTLLVLRPRESGWAIVQDASF